MADVDANANPAGVEEHERIMLANFRDQQRRREEFGDMHSLFIRATAILNSYIGTVYANDELGAESYYAMMRMVRPILEQAVTMSDTSYATYFVTHAHCNHGARSDTDQSFFELIPVEWLRRLRSSDRRRAEADSSETEDWPSESSEQRLSIIYSIYRLGFVIPYGGRGYYGHDAVGILPPRGEQRPISEEAFRELLIRLSASDHA